MEITREQIQHVARLARLELPEGELETVREQLGAILEAVSKVSELDLSAVEPTSHPLALVNVWDEDEPRPSLSHEDALANAPDPHDGAFRVPAPPHDWPCGDQQSEMIDTLRLTAEEAIGLLERKDVSPIESCGRLPQRDRGARRRAPCVPPRRRGRGGRAFRSG